jgi:hypothetical protein
MSSLVLGEFKVWYNLFVITHVQIINALLSYNFDSYPERKVT